MVSEKIVAFAHVKQEEKMKVLIVGGVAGGASAATRLRRLDEQAEIIIFERGEYVSFANCGLPYYIGGDIKDKGELTVHTPESMKRRFNLDVRTLEEVVSIDRVARTVSVLKVDSKEVYTESYDRLIVSTGAEPVKPPIEGLELEGVFTLRNIPDTYAIDEYISEKEVKSALIVGGGFIGLEMVESLQNRGVEVNVAEFADHVIASLDYDMASDVHAYIKATGANLLLQNGVQSFEKEGEKLRVKLARGELLVDMVIMGIGVRPESKIAVEAGLEVGARKGIVVDSTMLTSDENIYAVGDVVEVKHTVSDLPTMIPLAGPANKQGVIAADNICGIKREYKGTQGTAIMKLHDLAVATTGISEKEAEKLGYNYDKVYLFSQSHASYYPGATPTSIKVIFSPSDERILGAQIVGFENVDKRIDVLATAVRHRLTATDLTELELAYAPPFSSAKDPVNMVGFVIKNLLENQVKQFHWHNVAEISKENVLLDVRTPSEYVRGHIENSINLPLDELRERLGELDKTKPLCIYCQSGQRSYTASCILKSNGFDVQHLAGGYRLYSSVILGKSPAFSRK